MKTLALFRQVMAYIQMVAWDGRLWGSDLASVPEYQLGRTDVVPHILSGCFNLPVVAPHFTQPAIVPPIPEPATWALLGLGGAALIWFRRKRPSPRQARSSVPRRASARSARAAASWGS